MTRRSRGMIHSLLVILLLIAGAFYAFGAPTGATGIARVSDQRGDITNTATQIDAQAGNVTELQINATKLSDKWQGYYGNISGHIILADANNFSLYEWNGDTSVSGEVYAADAQVSNWGEVYCLNTSGGFPGGGTACSDAGYGSECLNYTEAQTKFGGNLNDAEGLNSTFTSTGAITIGSNSLTACPSTNLYENSTIAGDNSWQEVMLWQNATETLIFASTIEDNEWGFNNNTWDFQMIVGANSTNLYQYYFYIELD